MFSRLVQFRWSRAGRSNRTAQNPDRPDLEGEPLAEPTSPTASAPVDDDKTIAHTRRAHVVDIDIRLKRPAQQFVCFAGDLAGPTGAAAATASQFRERLAHTHTHAHARGAHISIIVSLLLVTERKQPTTQTHTLENAATARELTRVACVRASMFACVCVRSMPFVVVAMATRATRCTQTHTHTQAHTVHL